MRAARLHEPGKPMRVDQVDRPQPRPSDVLVQVKACGVIPNMNAVFSGRYWHHLPPLPAIVGLDAAGVVAEVGRGREQHRGRGSRLCQPAAVLRRLSLLPIRNAAPLQLGGLPGLLRLLSGFDEADRSLSVWRVRRVHDGRAAAAGQASEGGDVRSGRSFRLSRNVVLRSQVRRCRGWKLGRHQRHHRHARGRCDAACAGDGSDPDSGLRPQSRGAGAGEGAVSRPHRYDGARRPPRGRLVARSHRWSRGRCAARLHRSRRGSRARPWTRSEVSSGAAWPSTSARFRSRCRSMQRAS